MNRHDKNIKAKLLKVKWRPISLSLQQGAAWIGDLMQTRMACGIPISCLMSKTHPPWCIPTWQRSKELQSNMNHEAKCSEELFCWVVKHAFCGDCCVDHGKSYIMIWSSNQIEVLFDAICLKDSLHSSLEVDAIRTSWILWCGPVRRWSLFY